MKTNKLFLLSVFTLFVLVFSACEKDDDDTTDPNAITVSNVNVRLQEYHWEVSNYVDATGTTDNVLFSGYRFTFWWDDEVNGTRDGLTEVGTWTLAANGNSVETTWTFPEISVLGDLNGTWEVTALKATTFSATKTDSNNERIVLEVME